MRQVAEYKNNKRVIIKKPELLAPAGNLHRLKVAISFGADAVFIGGKDFSLRANAKNFSLEDMAEGVKFAKKHNAKVYVTSNIFAHENDFTNYIDYIKHLEQIGVSGIIVADPSYITITKANTKNLECHLSTQQSTLNSGAINFWSKKVGCERVVLGREVTKEQLQTICANVECEIEAFVHGAMCMSYSGKCSLSNHFTARDSNRGGCVQSCRWDYKLANKGENVPTNIDFSFSAKDLALIEQIPDFIEFGVDSLKIEGRMKSDYYIANIINAYRKIIDAYCSDPDGFILNDFYIKEVHKSANRPLMQHYYLGQRDYDAQIYNNRSEHPTQEFVALCLQNQDNKILCQQRNVIEVGDKLEVFGPNRENEIFIVEALFDTNHDKLERVNHPMMEFYLKTNATINQNDFIRKVIDKEYYNGK